MEWFRVHGAHHRATNGTGLLIGFTITPERYARCGERGRFEPNP
ncbi:hypothetical protein C7S17_7299 [Burkholderia thailandensis]|uniref:Uncharacterized protein n=1 Tax=Burkholderia phage phiE255 TaxID=2883942 RepID=A4JWJ8_9CAUD|nr:gp7, hypothetical protein [Burkholderia phage phiE255]ABO60699.1 gp7, hypothetical protein [Burkholderia phage phiE255]MDW9235684.1 hypothetical protein [Burkholderia thailandensis]